MRMGVPRESNTPSHALATAGGDLIMQVAFATVMPAPGPVFGRPDVAPACGGAAEAAVQAGFAWPMPTGRDVNTDCPLELPIPRRAGAWGAAHGRLAGAGQF
jgi:hypothetical protein